MKKILYIVITIVLVACGAFFANKFGVISFDELFGDDGIKVEKTKSVVTEIKKISKLTTACYYGEIPITNKKKSSIANSKVGNALSSIMGKNNALMEDEMCVIINGKVRAGYDLSEMSDSDFSIGGDSIVITMPEVKIFDAITNPSDVDIFVESGEWSHAEITKLEQEANKKLLADAKSAGILDKAKESGLQQLETIFKSLGYKRIIFN
ncbi:MAG: DUF4230 domain-containing protein [Candidatus Limisoma sp.]